MTDEEQPKENEPSEISEVPKRGRGRLPGYKRTPESIAKQIESRRTNKLLMEHKKKQALENEQENI